MTSVKISLENEVRRVLLRGEDGTTLTFHKLINTLYNLFPSLAGKVFSLTWQDDEGDTVTCSSDAELEEAILVMQGKGKVLRFTVQTQGGEAPVKPKLVHGSVTCDECGVKPIVGIRYKCAIRHDYDLCEACEGKRIQPYPMIKIVEPSQAPQILIYGLPDGTRNDEGGNAWPRGWRHGHGGPHHPHHRGPGFFAPNFAAPPAPFPAPAPAPAPTEGGHHPRRGRGCWARRWVPAEAAVPTAEVKVENPVTSEKTDEQSQLEEELIEKAILESLEINDNAKPVKVEGSSTASIVVEPAVVVNTTTPVVPPAAVAAAPLPVPSVKLSMRGVKDVTFPDGTIVQPGTIFRKVWRIRNDGSQAWPEGVALVSVGGDLMGNPNARESIPSVAPNEEATVAVSLTAPTSPGMYTAYYRLQTKDQQFFGNRLWATVVVSDQDPDWHVVAQKPESPTPTPQPAPIAPTSAVTFVTPDVANVAAPVKSEDSVPAPPATPVNTIPAPVAVSNPTAPVVVPPSAPEPAAVAPNRAASLLWRRELELLREMGFTDNELVIPLLQTHLGSPLSLSGDKNARPNAEGMQQVVAALLNLMN